MRFWSLLSLAGAVYLLASSATPVSAQAGTEEPPILADVSVSDDGAVTTYRAGYFARFSPLLLEDMLQRIPGVSISESIATEERRGLRGNEDAILINGQQITGKDSGGASALSRIAASQVKYIEVIRGATSEVQSTTQQIINIVLNDEGIQTIVLTAGFLTYTGDDSVRVNPSLTYSEDEKDRNYTVHLRNNMIHRPWKRAKLTSDLNGTQTLSSEESEQRDTHLVQSTGRFERSYRSGARLQLNALAAGEFIDRERREVFRNPQQPAFSNRIGDILEIDNRNRLTAEFSTDYSHPMKNGDVLTMLGLLNWEKETRDREVFDLEPLNSPVTTVQDRQDLKTEVIGRGVYDWMINPSMGAQIGLEGTLNTQDTEFELLSLQNGELRPVPVFNSNGKVTEYRGEVFSTTRWKAAENINVEIGLAVEASRITQSGSDVDSARSLVYAKPTFNTFWDVTPQNKVILSVARDVKQLNFLDFVASIADQDQELEAGNPGLNPERSWDAELGIEHRLKDGAGVASLTTFYRRVEDVSGRLIFENLISQIGNIGDGDEYGAKAELSLQFTRLGWWDGVLTSSYVRRSTSVTDPIDGLVRRFDSIPNWEFSLNYRHDVNFLINGFVDVIFSKSGRTFVHDVDYVESVEDGKTLDLKFFHRLTDNTWVNFNLTNILNRSLVRDRNTFVLLDGQDRVSVGRRVENHQWGRLVTLFFRSTF